MQLVCPAGENLLQYIRKKNIRIPALCAGNGSCGSCRIRIAASAGVSVPSKREREVFSREELEQGWRLACLQRPAGPVRIEIPDYREEDFEILAGRPDTEEKPQPGHRYGIALDLGTTTLALALTDLTEGRVIRTVSGLNRQRLYGADVISRIQAAESGNLHRLSELVKEDIRTLIRQLLPPSAWAGTEVTIAANTAMIHLLLGLSCGGLGSYPFRPLTLGGEELPWSAVFGDRPDSAEKTEPFEKTNYTEKAEGAEKAGCTEKAEGAEKTNYIENAERIEKTGRTEKAEQSGKAGRDRPQSIAAEGDGRDSKVRILRGISSFIGADITAGIYALDLDLLKGNTLFLDLGTNGEMVLVRDGRISCASAAAGPALEGGNLSCGTGSVPGAVCGLEIRGSSVLVQTIGGKAPAGFCGSGVIETAAALLEAGLMDHTGRLCEDLRGHGFDLLKTGYILQGDALQGKGSFNPGRGEKTPFPATGKVQRISVCMTQEDIRQLQLAKAAIRAGIEILLRGEGLACGRIDRVFLAGAFGTFLNPRKAAAIGLIPEELAGKAEPAGNTSLAGAVKSLCEPDSTERIRRIAEQAKERILANESGFEELFIRYMDFPDRQ